jgi:hypothetical protein
MIGPQISMYDSALQSTRETGWYCTRLVRCLIEYESQVLSSRQLNRVLRFFSWLKYTLEQCENAQAAGVEFEGIVGFHLSIPATGARFCTSVKAVLIQWAFIGLIAT